MGNTSRRTHLQQLALTLSTTTWAGSIQAVAAEPKHLPSPQQTATIQSLADKFIHHFQSPGLSVAIAHHGTVLFKRGFGFTAKASRRQLTSDHLFRIASIAKPITSVAIFSLIEKGKFSLDDLVFGPRGLLKHDYGENLPADVKTITIQHLLTHTCGGWGSQRDPMFHNLEMSHRQLITSTVKNQPLLNKPGTHFEYSNFGYCILGRVIEKISGQSYERFIQDRLLSSCGIKTMKVAGNTAAERDKQEVAYEGQNDENPYDMNVRRMDSHGGWIASASDLVHFAMHLDGTKTSPGLLKPASLKTMTTASKINLAYACGWNVNNAPNWWHTGSLPGSTTIMVRTASGLCWAALANTRTTAIDNALDRLMWQIVKAVTEWEA